MLQTPPIVFNNKLYFAAADDASNMEMWVYDGTNAPTQVADIYSGTTGSFPVRSLLLNTSQAPQLPFTQMASLTPQLTYAVEWNGKLYFAANDGSERFKKQLWSFDGTNLVRLAVLDPVRTCQLVALPLSPFADSCRFLQIPDSPVHVSFV